MKVKHIWKQSLHISEEKYNTKSNKPPQLYTHYIGLWTIKYQVMLMICLRDAY